MILVMHIVSVSRVFYDVLLMIIAGMYKSNSVHLPVILTFSSTAQPFFWFSCFSYLSSQN